MLEFFKQNWHYILTICQTLSIVCLTLIVYFKNRKLKLLSIVESSIEKAEQLEIAPDKKKEYAVALIKQEINASDKSISGLIESFIDFSKNVNAKSKKTIQEVLNSEFSQKNQSKG